jgi:hypothetical protein
LIYKGVALLILYPGPESNRYGFPQVFETSASTNSATRAFVIWESGVQNYPNVFDSQKILLKIVRFFAQNYIFHYICDPYLKAMNYKVKLFSGSTTRTLAEKISKSYGQDLGKVSLLRFSDGEIQTSYEETVRGSDVFIIQSTMPPTDNLFELLLMIDAATVSYTHLTLPTSP